MHRYLRKGVLSSVVGGTILAVGSYVLNLQLKVSSQDIRLKLETSLNSKFEKLESENESKLALLNAHFQKAEKERSVFENRVTGSVKESLNLAKRELEIAKAEVKMERGQDIRNALITFQIPNDKARELQLEQQDGRIKEYIDSKLGDQNDILDNHTAILAEHSSILAEHSAKLDEQSLQLKELKEQVQQVDDRLVILTDILEKMTNNKTQ